MAGLLAINRGSRRSKDAPGLIDNFAGWIGGKGLWQIVAGASALGAFAHVREPAISRTHCGPRAGHGGAAVSAFQHDVGPLDIVVNSDWIYGVSSDGQTTHIARFSPTLYRAMDHAGIDIGIVKYPMQFPVPGALPILLLIGLCAVAMFAGRTRDNPWTARSFLGFALLNLYVVFWLVSAQIGLRNPRWLQARMDRSRRSPLLVAQLVLIPSIL